MVVNTADAQLNVGALALAVGDSATARANAYGINQNVGYQDDALDAAAQVTNDGLISVIATASVTAFGAEGYGEGFASASAYGINQFVEGQASALALVDNAGTISVAANAVANGVGEGYASASARAFGIGQYVVADGDFSDPTDGPTGHATAHLINGGLIDVAAHASAFAEGSVAIASAFATGLVQNAEGSTHAQAIFDNFIVAGTVTTPGVFSVLAQAQATATASSAQAAAYAFGVEQAVNASTGNALASVVNPGEINIAANATATADGIVRAGALRQRDQSVCLRVPGRRRRRRGQG